MYTIAEFVSPFQPKRQIGSAGTFEDAEKVIREKHPTASVTLYPDPDGHDAADVMVMLRTDMLLYTVERAL